MSDLNRQSDFIGQCPIGQSDLGQCFKPITEA